MSTFSFPSDHGDVSFDEQDLARIGSGAVSDVHRLRVPGHGDVAIKLYKEPTSVDWERIRRLVELSARLERLGIVASAGISFPRAVLRRGHTPAGICLPLFPQPDYVSLDNWIEVSLLRKLDESLDNLTIRLKLIANLSEAVSFLHTNDIAVVDLKPANILVDRRTLRIAILDTDSFGFIDDAGKKFNPTHVSAGYIDPRSYSDQLDVGALWQDQDLYALSVIAFQLLNHGVHPYQCVSTRVDDLPPTNDEKAKMALYAYGLSARDGIAPISVSVHTTWPIGIRQLFDRTFLPGKERPSAAEWRAEVGGILQERELARCSRFPNDPRHIHFMNHPCGRCILSAARASNDARRPPHRRTPAIYTATPPARQQPIGNPQSTGYKLQSTRFRFSTILFIWMLIISSFVLMALIGTGK